MQKRERASTARVRASVHVRYEIYHKFYQIYRILPHNYGISGYTGHTRHRRRKSISCSPLIDLSRNNFGSISSCSTCNTYPTPPSSNRLTIASPHQTPDTPQKQAIATLMCTTREGGGRRMRGQAHSMYHLGRMEVRVRRSVSVRVPRVCEREFTFVTRFTTYFTKNNHHFAQIYVKPMRSQRDRRASCCMRACR